MAETKFDRSLSSAALDYLRSMPSWWRDVLNHRYRDGQVERSLLIALRAGYLNVYAEGQSILKIAFDTRVEGLPPVRARINRKYVFGPQVKDDYLIFDGARIRDPADPTFTQDYLGPEAITRWVEAARLYRVKEKEGVARIMENNPNVIDVEMALPANEPPPGEAKVARRMDIVALERASNAEEAPLRLAFYEAKLFRNSELRDQNLDPKVVRQLHAYRDYISEPARKKQVIDAYRRSCAVLGEITHMRGIAPSDHVKAIAQGELLDLDPMPRLIVFDFDEASIGEKSSWHRHEQALRAKGIGLVMSPRPDTIRLPA
ncbi:hypothetical protein ACUXK4_001882 [Methylorubrum extorquens]